MARADGSYLGFLGRLSRLDLLILDDWGLAPLTAPEARDLLEVVDDPSMIRSTLVFSQLTPHRGPRPRRKGPPR